jgi:pyruvate dehydrogenase E1 component alpha subunit
MIELSEEILLKMYYKMNQARFFEEKVGVLLKNKLIYGRPHSSITQEASGVIPCLALEKDDLVFMTHRCYAQAIGFGLDVNLMMAELLGKATGYSKGKGGSMHIADSDNGNFGGNGIVGGEFSLACGAALTQKYKKTDKVVLCFGGDGSANTGSFHESLNLASVWKLPVIFFIENNYYGMSTPMNKHMAIENISECATSYDMPGLTINGNDPIEIYNVMLKALRYARAGRGPVLIEAKMVHFKENSISKKENIRSKEELKEWREKDPIIKLKKYLKENRVFTDKQIQTMEDEAKKSIEVALDFATKSPDITVEEIFDDVYA